MRWISWLAAKPVSFSRRTLLHGVSKCRLVYSCQNVGGTRCLDVRVVCSVSIFGLPWRWRQENPQKHRALYTNLHAGILYSTEIFINTAVTTSNFVCTSWSVFLNSCVSPSCGLRNCMLFVPNFSCLIQHHLKFTPEIWLRSDDNLVWLVTCTPLFVFIMPFNLPHVCNL